MGFELRCPNGTQTAFQIRHSRLDVRLHFGCGKGSDVMAPTAAKLYGACEYTASLKGQLGFELRTGGVQSTAIDLT